MLIDVAKTFKELHLEFQHNRDMLKLTQKQLKDEIDKIPVNVFTALTSNEIVKVLTDLAKDDNYQYDTDVIISKDDLMRTIHVSQNSKEITKLIKKYCYYYDKTNARKQDNAEISEDELLISQIIIPELHKRFFKALEPEIKKQSRVLKLAMADESAIRIIIDGQAISELM